MSEQPSCIMTYPYEIFCGDTETMEIVKSKGIRALNPKTMKYQVVNSNAKYQVVKFTEILYGLNSDTDIRGIARERGLIL